MMWTQRGQEKHEGDLVAEYKLNEGEDTVVTPQAAASAVESLDTP